MKRFLALSVLLTFTIALPFESQAGETADLLEEAIELLQAGNLAEAREVTAIALDQMDYELLDTTAATFPLTVGAFTRGEVETQKAMGMDITSCVYRDADGNEIEVQMMGGGGGVLGNIADLGATFGGGRKVRIQGRTGTVLDDGGDTTLMLKLKSGKNLTFTSDNLGRDVVTGFAEEFPVKEVDDSAS
jgi:hypothetical protein